MALLVLTVVMDVVDLRVTPENQAHEVDLEIWDQSDL